MVVSNYVVNLTLSGVLIVGGYQFYFWCQRHPLFEPREFHLPLDARIPYVPAWVWVYSLLYYPAILCVNVVLKSAEQFTRRLQLLRAARAASSVFRGASGTHAPALACAQGTGGAGRLFGATARLGAALRRPEQQFPQYAHVGGNAHRTASVRTLRPAGVCFPRADWFELRIHKAALPRGCARWCGARLARLPRFSKHRDELIRNAAMLCMTARGE
jgi:hypothetical protein